MSSQSLGSYQVNTIVVGDCLEVMRNLPDRCVDLVVTDPPYGIKITRKSNKCGIRKDSAQKGKRVSEETKRKISSARKKYWREKKMKEQLQRKGVCESTTGS